ncbi:MAG: iron-sulfur cluster assembly scaffold protein, partial [Pyrinomonadaceae bacterium]|nr:iron-sulfur cluster assembly scaffold protein [Pyrinomonadaceae bacterium]
MSLYPPKIESLFNSPRNAGRPASCSAEGKAVTFECGCFVEIGLDVARDGTIRDAKFRSDGCGYMIASAQAVTEGVTGMRLTELHGV